MGRLGYWVFAGILSCSAVAPPLQPHEAPSTPPAAQTIQEAHPTTSTSTPTSKASLPPEGALLPGAVLRVVELAPEDPLAKESPALVGLLCAVGEASLLLEEDGYARGDAVCGPRRVLTRFTRAKLSLVYQPQKTPADSNPAAPFREKSLGVGEPFVIRAIGGSDAYFKRAAELIGSACVVTRELKNTGGRWFSGAAKCGAPAEFMYFSKVSLELK